MLSLFESHMWHLDQFCWVTDSQCYLIICLTGNRDITKSWSISVKSSARIPANSASLARTDLLFASICAFQGGHHRGALRVTQLSDQLRPGAPQNQTNALIDGLCKSALIARLVLVFSAVAGYRYHFVDSLRPVHQLWLIDGAKVAKGGQRDLNVWSNSVLVLLNVEMCWWCHLWWVSFSQLVSPLRENRWSVIVSWLI